MAVLKKLRSATLVEAIIATILIVIVFMTASLIINNLLLNNFSKNTHQIDVRLNELEYQIQNNQTNLPYQETYENWEITIKHVAIQNNEATVLLATSKNKTVTKRRIDAEK